MEILTGTSGFSFKEWKGPFYPEKLASKDMLAFYGERFPTVEINNTFYRLPKRDVLQSWADQVPDGFRFSIKASRRITHFERLKDSSYDALGYLLSNTEVLGDKLGPILFQCPPNMKQDLPRLRAFAEQLPKGREFAFEFRHDSWLDEATYDLLRELDLALCSADVREEGAPVVPTSTWGYLRLRRVYDDAALTEWARTVASQPWKRVYVFLKHDEGDAPKLADRFSALARTP